MNEKMKASLRENLVRPYEIAARIGVRPPAVANYQRRYGDYPEPVISDELGMNGTYWWPEVKEWLELHKLPGKPRVRKKDREMIIEFGWPGTVD